MLLLHMLRSSNLRMHDNRVIAIAAIQELYDQLLAITIVHRLSIW